MVVDFWLLINYTGVEEYIWSAHFSDKSDTPHKQVHFCLLCRSRSDVLHILYEATVSIIKICNYVSIYNLREFNKIISLNFKQTNKLSGFQ